LGLGSCVSDVYWRLELSVSAVAKNNLRSVAQHQITLLDVTNARSPLRLWKLNNDARFMCFSWLYSFSPISVPEQKYQQHILAVQARLKLITSDFLCLFCLNRISRERETVTKIFARLKILFTLSHAYLNSCMPHSLKRINHINVFSFITFQSLFMSNRRSKEEIWWKQTSTGCQNKTQNSLNYFFFVFFDVERWKEISRLKALTGEKKNLIAMCG
jgi:hypothetical protein